MRCTTVGCITDVQSIQKVEVDGVPRHVTDVRLVPSADAVKVSSDDAVEVDDVMQAACDNSIPQQERATARIRRPPDHFGSNIYDI
jgi:hypothetical protein